MGITIAGSDGTTEQEYTLNSADLDTEFWFRIVKPLQEVKWVDANIKFLYLSSCIRSMRVNPSR